MSKDANPIIQTTDENGEQHSFKLVEIVEVNKQEYGLFEYVDNDKPSKSKNADDEEMLVMKIINKKGESFFEVLEDEEEFETVLDYIEKYQDELTF